MTSKELYETLRRALEGVLAEEGMEAERVEINARGLTPEEAIGHTQRTDFPILTGKEVMLMATFRGGHGTGLYRRPGPV